VVDGGADVLVAVSGGADSLALAAATAFEAPRQGLRAGAVVVDHGLQQGSARAAGQAAQTCRELSLDPVVLTAVRVPPSGQGPEAAAREARYAALAEAADQAGAGAVLLGHTRDDQAETVLLALARGSGTRSLAGMAAVRDRWHRPLLGVPRATTHAACAALGLAPFDDPHNADASYTRVRARALLPVLERELGPGVVSGLARSAELARDDADALDALALAAFDDLGRELQVRALVGLVPALRRRVLRLAVAAAGGSALTSAHLAAVDALVTDWHGQGPVALPGGLSATRRHDRLLLAHL